MGRYQWGGISGAVSWGGFVWGGLTVVEAKGDASPRCLLVDELQGCL